MKEQNKYSIVIVDPSAVFSEGLSRILNSDPECSVIECYTDYDSFAEKAWRIKADVILFNPIVISSHKVFLIRNLLKECKDTTIIAIIYTIVAQSVISEFNESIDIFEKPENIIRKIKSSVEVRSRLQADSVTSEGVELSEREKEMLVAVAQGLTNKEIADKYNISVHTVISHRKNISRKTGIRTVSGLTMYALLNNLLQ